MSALKITNVVYGRGSGLLVSIQGPREGLNIVLGEHMTIAAIENYLHEVIEWLS